MDGTVGSLLIGRCESPGQDATGEDLSPVRGKAGGSRLPNDSSTKLSAWPPCPSETCSLTSYPFRFPSHLGKMNYYHTGKYYRVFLGASCFVLETVLRVIEIICLLLSVL